MLALYQRKRNMKMNTRALWSSTVAALNLLFGTALAAEPPAAEPSPLMQWLTQDYMLGNWGGFRTELSQHGVDFEFLYAGSLPVNLDGGLENGSAYQGGLLMLLDVNSEKLLDYPGGTFHVGSLWLHGEKPFSDRYIGDLNKVNLLDLQNGAWLWEIYYEQKLWENKLSVKAGQLAIDRDFVAAEYYNSLAGITLLNQTFFYPTMAFNVWDIPFFPVGHHGLASTPYGTPGVRVRYDPCEHAYVQAGVYDGNPDTDSPGTHFDMGGNQGALIYFETGWKLNQEKDATGLPGNLKLGGYYHTDEFYDMYEGSFAAFDNYLAALGLPGLGVYPNPATHDGNYGVYFLADTMLWRETGKEDPAQQGLTGFFRVGYAPEDRNLATWGLDGGLVYKGLVPKRDWDTLALGLSYLKLSDDLADAQQDINAILGGFALPPAFPKTADYEAVIELSYKAQITAWWTVQTSIERVFHPGGRAFFDIPDSWAFSVQTMIRF